MLEIISKDFQKAKGTKGSWELSQTWLLKKLLNYDGLLLKAEIS